MNTELTLATVLFDAGVGVLAVLYAISRGYLGHPRRIRSVYPATSVESYTAPQEQALEFPTAITTTVAERVASPVQAIYETVQPAPASVQPATPSSTSFGAASDSKKPTRTYRRRPAPVRNTSASAATLKSRTKRR